jgi:hypothetical protein
MNPPDTRTPETDRLQNRGSRALSRWTVTISAALLFVAVCSYRLDRPGLFYDELHQATGAFAYIGKPTTMFSFVPIAGVPLLNMSYTGAIKTALYGMYLRVSERPFTIVSWRLLGILFVASGLLLFVALVGQRMPPVALGLFLAVTISDLNLVLQARHDWGPAALAFMIRMVFLGAAIRHFATARPLRSAFLLGLIVGVAMFEKLSSTVLLGPLVVFLFAHPRTRSIRALCVAATGVALGALPVIIVNLHSLITSFTLLALTAVDTTPRRSLLGYAANYLVLGNGGLERRMMFEVPSHPWAERTEGIALLAGLAIVAWVAWTRRADERARYAGIMLLCFAAVGVALPLLPHGTAEHHWVIGTPFQYLALGFAGAAIVSRARAGAALRAGFLVSVIVLLAARIPPGMAVAEAWRDERYSLTWDDSLNTAAAYIANQPASTIFIAANWGIGTQVFCLANGRQDFVFELFWNYGGPETLYPVLAPADRQLVLAAALRPAAPILPGTINTQRQVTDAIFKDLATAPGWEEVPLDPAIRSLRAVEIRAFRRTPARPEL